MMRPLVCISLVLLTCGCASTQCRTETDRYASQPKHTYMEGRRVAVLPPTLVADRYTKHSLSPMVENALTGLLTKRRVILVERSKVSTVLSEQDVPSTDPATAAKVGRLLGAELVCVTSCEYEHLSGAFGGTSTLALHVRIVDTDSGRVFFSRSILTSRKSLVGKYDTLTVRDALVRSAFKKLDSVL